MGAAYFIALDRELPGFDIFVNGKAIAREAEAIATITKTLGLADINELTSFAKAAAEFGVDPELPAAQEKWFEVEEGLRWVRELLKFISERQESVERADRVISDLEQYEEVLQQAAKIKARWHFEIDF